MRRSDTKVTILGDGKVALGITIGFVAAVLIYVFLEYTNSGNSLSDFSVLVQSLTLLVALSSTFIAVSALREQRIVRQAGTDPVILIHLGVREDTRALSTLEITNVGAGAARNVKVRPKTDFSEYCPDRILNNFQRLKAIKTIPQGHSISYNFGVGRKLLSEPGIPPLDFEVSYENIDGEIETNTQTIDVSELTLQRADTPVSGRVASSVEKIEKSLAKLTRHQELHVVAETQTEYEERKSAEFAALEEMISKEEDK